MKIRTILILLALQMLSQTIQAQDSSIRAYLPSYRMKQFFNKDITGRTPWYSIHPFSSMNLIDIDETLPPEYAYSKGEMIAGKFDQIYYFSAIMNENGDALLTQENLDHLKFLQRIKAIYGTDIVLCISGDSGDFIPLLRDDAKRSGLLEELVSAIQEYDLAGIDLDWEFPKNVQEIDYFMGFLNDLRDLCSNEKTQLSIAASRFRALPEEAYEEVDFINLMTYDFYGRHSTVESTIEAVEYMMARYEIPPEKILMGIPFYGRIFDGYSPDYWKKSQSYRELVKLGIMDEKSDEIDGYYFNGANTVLEKIRVGQSLSLGGFFIWEIGQDSFGQQSLTRRIMNEVHP